VLTLTGPDGTQYRLTSHGKIGEEIRPDGKTFILSDSGITAVGTGETVQFVWGSSPLTPDASRLTSVTGPDGHKIVYTYDQQRNLVSARDLLTGDTSRYGYSSVNSPLTIDHSPLTLITHTGQPGQVIEYPSIVNGHSSSVTSLIKTDLGAAIMYLQQPYLGSLSAGSVDQLVFAVRPSEINATPSGDVYIGVIVEGSDPLPRPPATLVRRASPSWPTMATAPRQSPR
jgi:YD repeat-containing protein